MLALLHAYQHGVGSLDVLKRGAAFLLAHLDADSSGSDYEPLWLGKILYAPYDIVRSAVLAALILHQEMFGTAG